MKKVSEWSFVAYVYRIDREEDNVLYSVVRRQKGESLEDAVARAHEQVKKKFEEDNNTEGKPDA